jgi:hypothetical protein
MFYKLKKSIATSNFYRKTRGILETRPMPIVPAGHSFVSMVSNNDWQMYLLSMKSLYSRIGSGHIVAIIDRDMPAEPRAELSRHFPGIEFRILEDIDVGPCQRGGTWERIIELVERSREQYVIQVDSDTLAFGADVREVVDCIAQNRAFTLSGGEREVVSMAEAARRASTIDHPYVGIATERLFDRYPGNENLRYVRGSSGFAGLAKGGFTRAQLDDFHVQMERLLPERWKEWGTEQCASNFSVANSPDAVVLPFPKYANFDGHHDANASSFLHFIGSNRFDDDHFADLGNKIIAELQQQG